MTIALEERLVMNDSEERSRSEPAKSISREAVLEIGELSDLVSYQFRKAHLRIYNTFSKKLENANITPAQYSLLCKIKYNEGVSQTALAKANGIERSTLGEVIDRFQNQNLVERRKHLTDRRAYALYLTDKGHALLRDILPLVAQHEAELLEGWTAEDRRVFLGFLKRLSQDTA